MLQEIEKTEKTDHEIVILTLLDSSYFNEIVNRYEKPLARYIQRVGYFDSIEIEDLLQDTFLKVYKNLNAYNSDLKFSSWIYRITHNVTIDFIRKKSVRPEGNYTQVDEEFIGRLSSDFSTDEYTINNELAIEISKAIDTLHDKYRDPIILYFFENKSYEEISDVLKIPPNTVATRLNRAKSKLKELLISKKND